MRNPKSSIFTKQGKDICFIHIPKTGGQSIYKGFGVQKRRHLPVSSEPRREEALQADYAFAIVRNPYARAVSLFYWFAQLHLKPTRRCPENAAFNQWCRNTDVNSFWQQIDIPYADRHMPMFRTQSYFLKRKDDKIHPRIKIFRMEKMSEAWAQVNKDLGTDFQLPHINKSEHSSERDELTEESKRIIRTIYSEDFENFYAELS